MVSALAWPLLVGGRFVTAIFARASGQDDEVEDEEEAFEDEILSMVSEGEQDGFLESDARDMIEGVMELDDNDVSSVMTHRSQVDALEENTDWDEMLRFTVESGRTRIPVYQEKIDNILEAIRLAPTSSGLQPFEVFVVTNDDTKSSIKEIAWNQSQVTDCSHLLVFAAWDNYTEDRINYMFDLTKGNIGYNEMVVYLDITINGSGSPINTTDDLTFSFSIKLSISFLLWFSIINDFI